MHHKNLHSALIVMLNILIIPLRIANISMDIAMDAEDGSESAEVAHLIESCECPRGYAGLSCQVCDPQLLQAQTYSQCSRSYSV